MVLDEKDLLQINATIMAGLLILFTISTTFQLSSSFFGQRVNNTSTFSNHTVTTKTTKITIPLNTLFGDLTKFSVMLYAIGAIIPFAYASMILIKSEARHYSLEAKSQDEDIISKKRSLKWTRGGFLFIIYAAGFEIVSILVSSFFPK